MDTSKSIFSALHNKYCILFQYIGNIHLWGWAAADYFFDQWDPSPATSMEKVCGLQIEDYVEK